MLNINKKKKISIYKQLLGDKFKDGLKVLDYGYGSGDFFKFLKDELSDFEYYGLECEGSLNINNKGLDFNNVHLAFVDSEQEKEFIESADVIILNSIFTHLKCQDFEKIMKKFENKDVFFSVFLIEDLPVGYQIPPETLLYGLPNCYRFVFYTSDFIFEYSKNNNVKIKHVGSYYVPHVNLWQNIFKKDK